MPPTAGSREPLPGFVTDMGAVIRWEARLLASSRESPVCHSRQCKRQIRMSPGSSRVHPVDQIYCRHSHLNGWSPATNVT